MRCFIVYPEVKDPAPAVLVIHEIFGLTDWARGVADQLAAAGYIAIAPDLLSGMGPDGGGTSAFADRDAVMGAVSGLPADQVTGDLNAAADYVKALPSCNGKLAVAGFCWGGGQSFRFACNRGDLKAACVFYGPPPSDAARMAKINCPVYGFYGGNDNRISATVPKTEESDESRRQDLRASDLRGRGPRFYARRRRPRRRRPRTRKRTTKLGTVEEAAGKTVRFLEGIIPQPRRERMRAQDRGTKPP